MDSERWERIQAIFHEAVALPPAEQGHLKISARLLAVARKVIS